MGISSSQIREYIMVTFVALLVWLYAEGENIKTYEILVPIQFVPATGQNLLINPQKIDETPHLTIKCSSSQKTQLDQLFDGTTLSIPLTENPNVPDGKQQILLKPLFTSLPAFAKLSVNITEVTPSQVTVDVKTLKTMELKIAEMIEGDSQLQDVVIEPPVATLHFPKDFQKNLSDSDTIKARLNQLLENLEPNQSHTLESVPLFAPQTLGTVDVRIDPPTAKVTFTLTRQTKATTLSSIAVRFVMPAASASQYDVQLINDEDKLIRAVKITGPNDLIDQITKREIKIWADLKLEADDLAKGVGKDSIAIVPHIQKPDAVKLDEAPGAINLRIVQRQ